MKKKYIDDEAVLKVMVNLNIQIHDAETDSVIKTMREHNIITTAGKNLIRDLIGDVSTYGVTYFANGTDDTSVDISDTALGSEVFRNPITTTVYVDKKVTFKYYLSSVQANGNTLKEAGLFGGNATGTADSGTLVAHVTHDDIVKTSSVAITFSWDITIA